MRIGQARVHTEVQSLDLQPDALEKAACGCGLTNRASGVQRDRPGPTDAQLRLRSRDVLVVRRLDRLGHTVKGLVEFVSRRENSGSSSAV